MAKYDAVVIGSGTGGMSAALTLAGAGKKTLLIEQHNLPGGCSTSFVRGRFEFDASLHEFCGVGEEGNWGMLGKLMMEQYKIPIKWIYAPDCFHVIGTARSGKKIDFILPLGKENCIAAMEKEVPGSKEAMEKFFALCEECDAAYTYFNDHMLDAFKKDGFVKTEDLLFMMKYPNFLKAAEQPYHKILRKIGMPEDAIDILDVYWGYIGADYEKFSFVHQAWMIYAYLTNKPAITQYTSHGLTTAEVERFRELGGDIWQNVRATKVKADESGKIIGVETNAGFIETNYVIANVNPQTAYTQLLDKNIKVPEREMKRISAEKHSVRIFNTYLGLNRSIEELGIKSYTYFVRDTLDNKKNFENSKKYGGQGEAVVVCYNVINPDASPKGTTIMTFTTCITEDVWADFTQEEYVAKKQEHFAATMKTFEDATGINIHDHIEEIEMASPWTFAHFLHTPEGTVYGYEVNNWDTMVSRLMAVKKDQPIHGFKTCGAAGARGDGFSQTVQSGNDVARLLLEEMKEDGR